jgi:hypothetical protein
MLQDTSRACTATIATIFKQGLYRLEIWCSGGYSLVRAFINYYRCGKGPSSRRTSLGQAQRGWKPQKVYQWGTRRT